MDTASLVDILRLLPRREPIPVASQVDCLCQIGESDASFKVFLRDLLTTIGRLFDSAISAFWLRDPNMGGGLHESVRVGLERSALTRQQSSVYDASVLGPWDRVEPRVLALTGSPTASIVAPLHRENSLWGVMQLVVRNPAVQWQAAKEAYLAAIRLLMLAIEPMLWRRIQLQTESIDAAQASLEDLNRQVNRIQRTIRQAIEAYLQSFSHASFGALNSNQQFCKSIHDLLEKHGLRIRCPECGHPAILRASPRKGALSGVFVFDHYIDGRRTFHGGTIALPALKLMAKPARRGRKILPKRQD